MTVARGGRVSTSECGCPCHATGSAQAPPAVPTVPPPVPPDAVPGPGHRSEVTHEDHVIGGVLRPAHEDDHALLGVAAVDPLKASRVKVHLVESRHPPVEPVQIPYERLQTTLV